MSRSARGGTRVRRGVATALTVVTLGVVAIGPTPAGATPTLPQPQAFAVGNRYACMRTTTGGVACWGERPGASAPPVQLEPTTVEGLDAGVTQVASGSSHACAVIDDGGVRCWGANSSGALGDGTTTSRATPVPVDGLPGPVTAVAVGGSFTCALTSVHAVLCWGSDRYGQLGDGAADDAIATHPTDVTGLGAGVAAISAGEHTACALLDTGAVRCWGDGRGGEVGNGQTLPANPTPVAVTGLDAPATSIASGGAATCAVLQGGTVRCWGDNTYGGLGDGTTASRSTAVAVTGLAGHASAVSVGTYATCAIDGGGAWCWGMNAAGVLGRGWTRTSQIGGTAPVAGLDAGVTSISVGMDSACATTGTGGWCWGEGRHGELATRVLEEAMAPVPIASGPPAAAPTSVTATPGDASATLSWSAPPGVGSGEVLGYAIVASIGGAPAYSLRTTGPATSTTFPGLVNGVAFTFQVAALTATGGGLASSPSAAVTPQPAPGAPTITATTAGNRQIQVTWTAPADSGGSAITAYRVTPHRGTTADPPITVAATARTATATGLVVGTTYAFTVAAVNAYGTGHESAPSPTVTAIGVAGAPTLVRAAPRNAAAVVTWVAPTSTGGAIVTAYLVTPYRAGVAQPTRTFGPSVRSATLSGLANAAAFTFRVQAVNAVGAGPASAASAAIIVGAPGAPTTPTGVAGAASVRLTWTTPLANGAAITGYAVTPYLGGVAQPARLFGADATTRTITGLTRGGAYTFTVRARNARGNGPASVTSGVIRPT